MALARIPVSPYKEGMQNTATTPLTLRRANERFHSDHGWLDTYHTFSFGDHHDPRHMGYKSLRVINDDKIAPGRGFGTHPHRSMEIFTYVISGELAHQDSMGNGRVIKAGEFQYMSAGSGVEHSEVNPSPHNPVHLLQIWITPSHPGGEPRYRDFDTKPLRQENGLTLLASPEEKNQSMAIRQEAEIHFGHLSEDQTLELSQDAERPNTWLHLISGTLELAGERLQPGDGASFEDSTTLSATTEAEFLLFRLA